MSAKTVRQSRKNGFVVKAWRGDNKTLLAFDFADPASAKDLAGFTIACQPPGRPSYYLLNELQFEHPEDHAQVATERRNSTVNAPLHKFRWNHFLGTFHQGLNPSEGDYTYTVTPRYFDGQQSMLPMNSSLSVSVTIEIGPFRKNGLSLGFTRGYMQSEAFTHHFGLNARIVPAQHDLLFDTSAIAGTDPEGRTHTYAEEYEWMGATARQRLFDLLNEVVRDPTLQLDMFTFDLNEPDLIRLLLTLAKEGRIRMILDNSSLHTAKDGSKPEDQFTALFQQAVPKDTSDSMAGILRGNFGRYAHEKVLIISKVSDGKKSPLKALTGSTNFSVTGLYVNANHLLVFDDATIAATYEEVFQFSWETKTSAPKFAASPLSSAGGFDFPSGEIPATHITFSPHTKDAEEQILNALSARIQAEAKKTSRASVLFAVMQLTGSTSPVYDTLKSIHQTETIFSYGISDTPGGVTLYSPGNRTGVLVTGRPGRTVLPPPFDQVPIPPGHEVHDKFVVCGFNGDDPVVYCGSSNLATGGEQQNGDNLLVIHDAYVATAFAIEALALVDHYSFLDRYVGLKTATMTPRIAKQPRSKQEAAVQAGMFLSTTDAWAKPYFDPKDLHYAERVLFA